VKLSAKGEYALRSMVDLAMHRAEARVSIQEIAARQAIPHRYLEQVLLQLKRGGLLESKRGATGGYHLTRPPDDITVADVLRAIEGEGFPFEPTPGRRGRWSRGDDLAELWQALADAVAGVIDKLTIGDLAAHAAARRSAVAPTYHI
jgi:Rrf2 family cysteine metabolism transcriptional repressor